MSSCRRNLASVDHARHGEELRRFLDDAGGDRRERVAREAGEREPALALDRAVAQLLRGVRRRDEEVEIEHRAGHHPASHLHHGDDDLADQHVRPEAPLEVGEHERGRQAGKHHQHHAERGAAVRRARDLALAALGAEDVLLGLEALEQVRRGALVVERRVERRVGAADALAGDARGLVRPPRPRGEPAAPVAAANRTSRPRPRRGCRTRGTRPRTASEQPTAAVGSLST